MSDLEQLRVLTEQVRPPAFASLAGDRPTSRPPRRRVRTRGRHPGRRCGSRAAC